MTTRKVSYSSLSLLELCPRKWYFKYVRKLPDLGGKGTAFGSALHTDLDRYLKTGDLPAPGRNRQLIERAVGWRYLPEPGSVDVELKFEVPFGEATLVGAVDVVERCDEELHVLDHKSGRDPRWRKTEQELASDAQLMLYLKGLSVLKGQRFARYQGRHLWYRSEGPIEVHEVGPVQFTPESLDKLWNEKINLVPVVLLLDDTSDVSIVGGNKRACDAYGGCPYRDACRLSWDKNTPSINNVKEYLHMAQLTAAEQLALHRQKKAAEKVTQPSPLPSPAEVATAQAAVKNLTPEPAPAPAPATPPVAKTEAPARRRIALLTNVQKVGGAGTHLYLDDLFAPAMRKIQETKGVPYFAIQYNEGVKMLAASARDVFDQLSHGDTLTVRGDISWVGLVLEQLRTDPRFEVVEFVGVR